MSGLALLDAFRNMAPVANCDERTSALRNEAATRLLKEMASVCRFVRGAVDLVEDAVQEALCSLARTGPRGVRENDPTDEAGIRAFLYVCLVNALISLQRREKRARVVPFGWSEQEGVAAQTEETEWLSLAHLELTHARRQLWEGIVPQIADGLAPAAASTFLQSVAEMREMHEAHVDFAIVVARHAEPVEDMADPHVNLRVRNRVYARHKEANKKLRRELMDLERDGAISSQRLAALEIVAGELRRTPGRAPAAARPTTVAADKSDEAREY